MNDVRHDELEWELKQRNEVAEILAKQLNEKIDECESWKEHSRALKLEVANLNELILSMTKHIK